jgi:tetratricopeptide (TPR) repeat protein
MGYMYKASAMLGLDDLKGAEAAFYKAHEIDQDLLLNEYRLAHTYRLQGRYNEAIAILKKLYQRHPDEISALYDLGINYQAMGNNEKAMINYQSFRKIAEEVWTKEYPDLAVTYLTIAAIAARTVDLKYSSEMLEKASRMDSTLHEKFAEILCLQGKITEAVIELEKAVKNGYRDLFWIKCNPDYQSLQKDYRFKNLISEYF